MWGPRQDVISVGAILSALPTAYTPDNVVGLVGELASASEWSVDTFVSLATKFVGLPTAQAEILFQYFERLIRPFPNEEWAQAHRVQSFGLFLVLQFLSQSANSAVARRKSTTSEVWPGAPEHLRLKPITPLRMPNEPKRALSERHLSGQAVSDALLRAHSERSLSLAAIKDALSPSPPLHLHQLSNQSGGGGGERGGERGGGYGTSPPSSPSPMGGRRTALLRRSGSGGGGLQRSGSGGGGGGGGGARSLMVPEGPGGQPPSTPPTNSREWGSMSASPRTRKKPSPLTALSPLSPIPTNLADFAMQFDDLAQKQAQWKLTPPKSHQFFQPFQAGFLLEHVSVLVRVCLAAVGRVGSQHMLRVRRDDVDGLQFLLKWISSSQQKQFALHEDLECFDVAEEVSFFELVSSLSKLLKDVLDDTAPSSTAITHHNLVHRKTVVHDNTFSQHHYLCFTNSFRSHVYCASPLAHCAVACVTNSTIFLGAVGGILTIQNCSGVVLVAVCYSLYINNCKDCVIHVACNQAPIFCGDNNNVQLAPLNAFYPQHHNHVTAVAIDTHTNRWDQPLSFNLKPMKLPMKTANFLRPEALYPLCIPAISPGETTSLVFPLPTEYAKACVERAQQVQTLRQQLTENPDLTDSVQAAIWARFKEWLKVSGNLRQVEDLVKLDLQSQQQQQTQQQTQQQQQTPTILTQAP